jgi:hypothetical protein
MIETKNPSVVFGTEPNRVSVERDGTDLLLKPHWLAIQVRYPIDYGPNIVACAACNLMPKARKGQFKAAVNKIKTLIKE